MSRYCLLSCSVLLRIIIIFHFIIIISASFFWYLYQYFLKLFEAVILNVMVQYFGLSKSAMILLFIMVIHHGKLFLINLFLINLNLSLFPVVLQEGQHSRTDSFFSCGTVSWSHF